MQTCTTCEKDALASRHKIYDVLLLVRKGGKVFLVLHPPHALDPRLGG